MSVDEEIRDEKLKYNIYREAAKTSALSSDKVDKFEYFTGRETEKYYLLIKIEQVYIFFSCKSIRKTNKNNWRTKKKQVETLQILKRAEQQKLKSIKDVFLKGQQNN